MREHFWIGIQMTGEVARGALPSEFLVETRDELLDGQPRRAPQHCRDQSSPLDLAVAVGLAQLVELRAGGPRTQLARRSRRASKRRRGFGWRDSRFELRTGAHRARCCGPRRRRLRIRRPNLTFDAGAQQLGDGSLIRTEQFECALESLQTLGQALDLLSARGDLILDEKLDYLGSVNMSWEQPEVKIPPRNCCGHRREHFPVEVVLQHRRVSAWRPSAAAVGSLAQSALVDEDDGAAVWRAFFKLRVCE